jgi:exonuclease 3'-5' domain-containing protein 1
MMKLPQPKHVNVYTLNMLAYFLKKMSDKHETPPDSQPAIFMSVEGINLRNPSFPVSFLQIYSVPFNTIYIIDFRALKVLTFSPSYIKNKVRRDLSQRLKSFLEDQSIRKGVFDLRLDSHALYKSYHLRLRGLVDIQILELPTRDFSREDLFSLQECIQRDSGLSTEDKASMKQMNIENVHHYIQWMPQWDKRPLHRADVSSIAPCVTALPGLWKVYDDRLLQESEIDQEFWRRKVELETKARLNDSQNKTSSYWAPEKKAGWNDESTIREYCAYHREKRAQRKLQSAFGLLPNHLSTG